MWTLLRGARFRGIKFRRQVVLGPFIVDFYCAALRLVVEVDGEIHATPTQQRLDENRDHHLRELGLRVLRFRNEEVLGEPETVLSRLHQWLRGALPGRP